MLAPSEWKAVAEEIRLGLNSGPLPAKGPLCRAIAGEMAQSLVVQYVSAVPITGDPHDMASVLDAYLRGQPVSE